MPFTLIAGTFRLVNRTKTGKATGFQPDGDSVQFAPTQPVLLDKLTRLVQPYRLTNIGSVMLRLEGIDALELHFQPDGGPRTHQPRPLADNARDALLGFLKLSPAAFAPPENLSVVPPAVHDAAPGFILSRSLEVHGRPVCFAFAGPPPAPDGSEVTVAAALLRRSLNFKLLRGGFAYPLFYDTLFADLRVSLTTAVRSARRERRGLWPSDRTLTGLTVAGQSDLETDGVLVPKLFRRLSEFLADSPAAPLSAFPAWLKKTNEQIMDIQTTNFTHLDNLVKVENGQVRMTQAAETFVIVSAK